MWKWFAPLLNWLKLANDAGRAAFDYAMRKIWILILPVVLAVKAGWDFCRAAINAIVNEISGLSIGHVISVSGEPATMGDILAFSNTMLPLEELFIEGMAIFALWQVCMFIRTVKGIKQTVAF